MIIPPPANYDGRFSEFYEHYIEPNLPSQDRVQAFGLQLRQHLSDEDPLHVVRYVRGQTRGTVYRTGEGWKFSRLTMLRSGGRTPCSIQKLSCRRTETRCSGRCRTISSKSPASRR